MTEFLNRRWNDMTVEELRRAWAYWNRRIEEAPTWGAGVAAADEFRRCAERELKRRGEPLL